MAHRTTYIYYDIRQVAEESNILSSMSKKFPKKWASKNLLTKWGCIRGTSILGEVRNVEIPGPSQQLLCSKYHDFLAIFALAHSKINQILYFLDDIIQEVSD